MGETQPEAPALRFARHDGTALLLTFGLVLFWDLSGLDLQVSRWFGSADGFHWTRHWLLGGILHDRAKYLAWTLALALGLAIWRPFWLLKDLTRGQRTWWLLTTIGCVLLISTLRRHSATSCPWELKEFGGSVAAYVPHWSVRTDGGAGQCFPSGHASTAFAFFAGWLALRGSAPRAARIWLGVTIAVGLLFGWVQVMRGAHYLSHSLWTGWICIAATLAAYHGAPCWRTVERRSPGDGLPGELSSFGNG